MALGQPQQGQAGLGVAAQPVGLPVGRLGAGQVAAEPAQLPDLVVALGGPETCRSARSWQTWAASRSAWAQAPLRCRTWERWTRQMPVNSTAAGRLASQRLVASVHSAARRTSASSWKAAIRWP